MSPPSHTPEPRQVWAISTGTNLSLQSGLEISGLGTPGSSNPVCAPDFSPHSSFLRQQVFVSRNPLGAVKNREGECGNLSGSGEGSRARL
jgi:hypothetical protein